MVDLVNKQILIIHDGCHPAYPQASYDNAAFPQGLAWH